MAVDEIQRLLMQVEGAGKVKELTELLAAQRTTLEQLLALQKQGPLTGGQQAQMMRTAAEAVAATKQLQEMQKTLGGAMSQMGAMQIGYALSDFFSVQGGIAQRVNSIANNLQMFAASMGLGGTWFLAITGIITALQVLAQNWDSISQSLTGIDEAKAKKVKEDIEKWKRKFEEMTKSPTPGQTEAAKGPATQIAWGPEGAVLKGAAAVMGSAPLNEAELSEQQDLQNYLGRITTPGGFGAVEQAWAMGKEWFTGKDPIKETRERLGQIQQQALARNAAQLVEQAKQPGPDGDRARKVLIGYAKQNPGAFPPGFATSLEASMHRGPSSPDIGPPMPDWGQMTEEEQIRRGVRPDLPRLPTGRLLPGGEMPGAFVGGGLKAFELPSDVGGAARPLGGTGPKKTRIERPVGAPTPGISMNPQLEMMQLQTMAEANQLGFQSEQMLGFAGAHTALQAQIMARLQAAIQRLSSMEPGAAASGLFSHTTAGPWP